MGGGAEEENGREGGIRVKREARGFSFFLFRGGYME